jgi:hypothetical protein
MRQQGRTFRTRSRLRAIAFVGLLTATGLLSSCDTLGITVFEILSVEAPSNAVWEGSLEVEVLWVGNPEWPVTWEVSVVDCVGTGYCNPGFGVASSYENPLTYTYYCDGASGSPPLTTYHEVRLTDANGARTSLAEYSFTCR